MDKLKSAYEGFLKVLIFMGTKLLAVVSNETILKWAFFQLATIIVKSTKTKLDDEWLAKIKAAYEEAEETKPTEPEKSE